MHAGKRSFLLFNILLFIWLLLPVSAAEEVSPSITITGTGFANPAALTDGDRLTYTKVSGGGTVTVSADAGIDSLYIVFDRVPAEWTMTDGAAAIPCGQNGFLHEFVDVEALLGGRPTSLTLHFPAGTSIDEIYAFATDDIPDWVQIWQPPCEAADILLLSSHSDDEQLFFAGILPLYAGEKGLDVQVVYLVHHFDTHNRPHEQLNGLWEVGVRHYPVISGFPDLYSESLDGAIAIYKSYGHSYEDFCRYITTNIRRFRPQVLITHDPAGEYSHGTHILCTAAVQECLDYAADPAVYPDTADTYGTWDVPKTYLHLYKENPIVMDFDTPLSAFGGKTAFQVSQDGFAHHKSQHWTWFYKWIYGTKNKPITKASQINYLSPCRYGLYRTTVGADVVGGDFFENLTSYAEQKAAEEAAKQQETTAADTELSPDTADTETEAATDAAITADLPDTSFADTSSPATEEPPEPTDPARPSSVVFIPAAIAVAAALVAMILLPMYMHPSKKNKR